MRDILDFLPLSSVHIYRHNVEKYENFIKNLKRCGDSIDFACIDHEHEDWNQTYKYRCMNRLCGRIGCLRKRRRRIYDMLKRSIVNMKNLKFITLTYADRHGLTRDIKKRLDGFFNLFIRKLKRDNLLLGGYIKVLEITHNEQGYYYHFHVLIELKYYHQNKLCQDWKKITGTSYIAWIERVYDRNEAINYVAKYMVKGIHSKISKIHWFNEFYGLKLYSVVGVRRCKKTPKNVFFEGLPYEIIKYPDEVEEELTLDKIFDIYELVT